MVKPEPAEKGVIRFTVYEDRFVILYFVILVFYLILGFLIFVQPLFDPGKGHDLKLSFMIVPILYSCLITLAVCGIAVRATGAPGLYVRLSRLFLPVLALSSLITFLRLGLSVSLALTVCLVLLLLPYILVLSYGRRYLKREDVRTSFAAPDR